MIKALNNILLPAVEDTGSASKQSTTKQKEIKPERSRRSPQRRFATVDDAIQPEGVGRVRYQGTSWAARFCDSSCGSVLPGSKVEVIARQGLTLLVVPEGYPVDNLPARFWKK